MRFRPLLAVLALAASFPAAAEIPAPVAAQLRASDLPDDSLAFVVRRAADPAPVAAHQQDRAMQPASTLKLLTSLVALETLGPSYRGRTQLVASGEVSGGVLYGDLALRGTGDVDLDWRAFERLLRLARLQGIREIRGDFVIDRSFFAPARTDVGAPPFDETPEFRYNVIPDALLVNTNLVALDIASDEHGVRAELTPALDGIAVRSELTLAERACGDWESGWRIPKVARGRRGTLEIVLRGEFPRRCTASTEINVIDRTEWISRLFRTTWRHLGGAIRGDIREAKSPGDARVIAEHSSRPLDEVVFDVNKRSDNPNTRLLFLTLGARAEGEGTTAQRAERLVRAWLERKGIDASGIVLDNGSGLSRTERIKPVQLAGVLAAAQASPWGPEFTASLPIVAVDGGMSRRLRDTAAAARARIKTGTLRDTSAIAGYVTDVAGETWIVVAMVNDPRARADIARPVLDSVIDWVATGREGSRP